MRDRFSPGEVGVGFLVALVARASTATLLLSLRPANNPGAWQASWATVAPDTLVHLESVENLLSTGTFEPDWRPPGYALPYLLLRLFFGAADAGSALCVFQVICSALAVLFLAAIALELEGSRRLALAVFITFTASSFTAAYDSYLLTESLAISVLIGMVWALLRLRRSDSHRFALAVGILGAWAVFLRPVLVAVVVGMGLWLSGPSMRKTTRSVVLLLPLAVGLGAWGGRGLSLHHKFEPLGPRWAPSYRPVDRALQTFVQAFGGSIVHWNPKAEIVWFEFMIHKSYRIPEGAAGRISFPSGMYTSLVTPKSLEGIKTRLKASIHPGIDEVTRNAEQTAVARDLERMTESIRSERPLFFYVIAPLRVLRSHLAHSGTVDLLPVPWRELSWPLLFFKLAMSGLYAWVVVFGLIGVSLFLLGPKSDPWGWALVAGSFLVPLLVYTVVLRLDEYRYFASSFPFALIFACRASSKLLLWRGGNPLA